MTRALARDPEETGISLPFGGVSRSVTWRRKEGGKKSADGWGHEVGERRVGARSPERREGE